MSGSAVSLRASKTSRLIFQTSETYRLSFRTSLTLEDTSNGVSLEYNGAIDIQLNMSNHTLVQSTLDNLM